jgi:hypothetical protein
MEKGPRIVAAHEQLMVHRYVVHFPEHYPRQADPHYGAFDAFRRHAQKDPERWRCEVGAHFGDFSYCTMDKPLEVHHRLIEFAAINGVDIKALHKDYPEVIDENTLNAFVESEKNFEVLCQYHHRGHAGAHIASHADFTSALYILDFIR